MDSNFDAAAFTEKFLAAMNGKAPDVKEIKKEIEPPVNPVMNIMNTLALIPNGLQMLLAQTMQNMQPSQLLSSQQIMDYKW